MQNLLRSRRSSDPRQLSSRGQALVEFGLVLPILLVIFAAAADFGRVFYGYVALENAVKEGALYGARYPLCNDSSTLCPNPDNVTWRVQNEARTVQNPDGTPITPVSACVDNGTGTVWTTDEQLKNCEPGDTYVVSASYSLNLLTPILGNILGGSINLSSQSTASVLNLAFDPTPGVSVTKLILASTARNAAEIRANCEQPDPTGSPDYFRSPCLDTVEPIGENVTAAYRSGDTIGYKVIVRNIGGTNVTAVTMTDSQGWSCGAVPPSMPVRGTPFTCSYTRPAPTIAGTATTSTYQNDFTVDGSEILAVTDSAVVSVEKPPANLRVLKYVSVYRDGADGDGSILGVSTFGTAQSLTVSYNSLTPQPYAWYKVIVLNTGGQAATDVTITDSNGALPFGADSTTAVCDAAPSTIPIGGRWECRYRATFSSATSQVNTVTATASNVTADADDTNTATVTAQECASANKVVPSLVGLKKSDAEKAWSDAGFTTTPASWNGNGAATVVAQNQQAFSCLPPTATITISRTATP